MKHAKCIMVCAVLIVAAFVLSGTMAPRVRAAGNVTVSVWGFYEPLMMNYYVWGEVHNVGDQPVTNVSINVNCYNVSNALVTSITRGCSPRERFVR
ncbi:MAG: FxLYD domain-containing protein [Candidatus Bathyarchaeia archaeon]|jgi:predicted MFS family arabinose efflux permease